MSVRNVSVTFRTPTDDISDIPSDRVRRALVSRAFGRPFRAEIHALDDVSFEVFEGEHVGIVGPNGSGKSTLMRVMAGVIPPDQGEVLASSDPTLLGVAAALLPHLTGSKNIQLGLLALGYGPEVARETSSAIADLADLGTAIDRPMNTYSSGMAARLRFAIGTATQPGILLIDEALGTGDASFVERAHEALEELRSRAGTIFLVSHAAQMVEEMCTRAIWLHQGKVIADGPAESVALHYRNWAWAVARSEHNKAERLLRTAMTRQD